MRITMGQVALERMDRWEQNIPIRRRQNTTRRRVSFWNTVNPPNSLFSLIRGFEFIFLKIPIIHEILKKKSLSIRRIF